MRAKKLPLGVAGLSPSGWVFVVNKQVLFCFGRGRWRISQTLGPQYPRYLTILQDPYLWGRTNFGLAQVAAMACPGPWLSTAFDARSPSLFEEEEEAIGIASNVVNVLDADMATPSSRRGDRAS